MNKDIQEYLQKYPTKTVNSFIELRKLIFESVSSDIKEILWAKLPSYYSGDSFVRLIPFKDHINVEASSIMKYVDELQEYKITPRGMLQIYYTQDIPYKVLKRVFKETIDG
ncbi:MAG: DUF1801 domain-containing protein [Erysipelotrichaceae bacterium]|nr:DUF1801 domain-containing protein [Erysipelotrichaceae bacterium]